MLVWDSFSAHLGDNVKKQLRECHNTHLAVIPGGLTSIVQPLDVCLNKPFKDRLREKWTSWMIDGKKTYTTGGNMRAASLIEVCTWVKEAWESIGEDMIERSFKKCGITSALDGTDDDLLWQDEVEERNDDDDDESVEDDIYDDALTVDDMLDLFGDSDQEGEEFHGFDEENA